MRMTENTDDSLRLDDVPWGITLILLGMVLLFTWIGLTGETMALFGAALCAVGLAFFAERTQFWADRPGGTVVLRKRSLRGMAERRIDLERVIKAEIETHDGGGRGGPTYRPVIRLQDGQVVPLRNAYTNGTSAGETVDIVNIWLGRNN